MFIWNEQIKKLDSIKNNIAEQFKPIDKDNHYSSVVLTHNGKVLLLRRTSTDKFHPETWCLVGGTIEKGETINDSMIREFCEETGLKENNIAIHNVFVAKENGATIYYFIGSLAWDEELQENKDTSFMMLNEAEHDQYMWCDIDKVIQGECGLELMLDTQKHLKILRDSAII